MSLRSRVAYLLLGLSIVLVVLMYTVQVLVVMPTFVSLEQSGAERDINRCVDALKRDLTSISNSTNDWASWDDTYQYIQDHNTTYEVSNLVDESFFNSNLNLICFVDGERRVVWGEVRDIESMRKIDVPDLFAAIQQAASPISTHKSVDDAVTGIVLTSQGPMMFASRPIITTKRKGPMRGSLIMGRFLNETEVDDLAARTHVDLHVWTLGQPHIPAEAQRILDLYSTSSETHIVTTSEQSLHAYRVLDDVYDQPAILLQIDVPRVVTAQGRVATRVAAICSLVGGGVTLIVIWLVLQKGVVNPLRYLAAHALEVGRNDDLKARLNLNRTDEIGVLAHEFDRMMEHLAEYRRKVLDSAHQSGMQEVASEVLHNVGNAVNSAGCSVEMLREELDESKLAGFDRATELLREQAPHAADFFGFDPRGAKLIDYLIGLNEALHQEHSRQQHEVVRLFETIRHIRDIITAQQTYTGKSEFRQEVNLLSIVDEALLLNQEQLRAHQIEVEVDLPPLPDLHLNKSKMTQVLVNLVRNAIQAMQGQASGARRLIIVARTVDETGIEIEVHDTGHGFNDEVRGKLFKQGFTTAPNGNGFGLHYCANAVQGAGGTITGESPGLGQGATFRIRLVQVIPTYTTATNHVAVAQAAL